MPDLSLKAAHDYWLNYQDPMIYRVLIFMESIESWSLDGNENLEKSIQNLGKALDDIGRIDLQLEDKFIELCAFIKASRMLLLMQCLDTAYPGAASKLLMHSEKVSKSVEDIPGLFLRRNIVFERLRLLGRILAPDRLTIISKVLEE